MITFPPNFLIMGQQEYLESKSSKRVVWMLLQVETIGDLVDDWNKSLPARVEAASKWNKELEMKYQAGGSGCCTNDMGW